METVLHCIPMKPRKRETLKAFGAEISGPRKQEYIDMQRRYGLQLVGFWYHKFEGREYALVLHLRDESFHELIKKWPESTYPIDQWFHAQDQNLYDINILNALPEIPEFMYAVDAANRDFLDKSSGMHVLFTNPIKPGKEDALKAFITEVTGPRRKEYADLLQRLGSASVTVWRHRFATQDYLMVLFEISDDKTEYSAAIEKIKSFLSSQLPFDSWIKERLLDLYDIESLSNWPQTPDLIYEIDSRLPKP